MTCLLCLEGVNIVFDVSNLGGELDCIFVDLLFLFFCHTCGYAFCLVFQEKQVHSDQDLLPLLATSRLGVLDWDL